MFSKETHQIWIITGLLSAALTIHVSMSRKKVSSATTPIFQNRMTVKDLRSKNIQKRPQVLQDPARITQRDEGLSSLARKSPGGVAGSSFLLIPAPIEFSAAASQKAALSILLHSLLKRHRTPQIKKTVPLPPEIRES